MITSEEIAVEVYKVLCAANLPSCEIVYSRKRYEKACEAVVVPHYSTGEGSMRTAVIKVNIHVPDIYDSAWGGYEINFVKLIDLKSRVISALKKYTWEGQGVNFEITSLEQPIKEQSYNEHFSSVTITAHIRERNS